MKKTFLILSAVFAAVTLALFPIDLLVCEVRPFVIVLSALSAVVSAAFYFARSKSTGRRIAAAALALSVILLSAGGMLLDPYFNNCFFRQQTVRPTLEYDTMIPSGQALSDLDYAMRYLKKNHPALQNGLTQELLEKYAQVHDEISSKESVSVNELSRFIESVFSLLSDGHTCAYTYFSRPLYLKHYYSMKQKGFAVSAINGVKVSELLSDKKELYSFEAESWELERMKGDLLSVQGLDYLGFDVGKGIEFTFENDKGESLTERYSADDFVTYDEYLSFNGVETSSDEKPFVSYSIDHEKSLALLTLDECVFNDQYVECLRNMFREVRDSGIQRVAVDLRNNGGGNDRVAEEFIRYLDADSYKIVTYTQRLGFLTTPRTSDLCVNKKYEDLTFDGEVYILTSAGTFSSAMLFAQYISDNRLGTLIGEPPGNDPNGYGEITVFRTPNAGIMLSISTKRFYRADSECADRFVMPDIVCPGEQALDRLYELTGQK